MADRVTGRLLDRLLRVAAERAAAPSGIRFTERQLYYELCRVASPLHHAPRRLAFTVAAPISYSAFRTALRRHGDVPGLLTLEPARAARAGRHTPEPDLFDYGLPRLLVCESDGIAQMLRANGLPMESACPVLSAAELPLDPGVADMLAGVEGTIYLLHDASPDGLTFPVRFAELTDIPVGVHVVPLGLRPRQVGSLHLVHLSGPVTEVEEHNLGDRTSTPHGSAQSALVTQSDSRDSAWTVAETPADPGTRTAATSGARARPGDRGAAGPVVRADLGDRGVAASVARADLGAHAPTAPAPPPDTRGSGTTSTAVQLDSWERGWLDRGRCVEVDAVRPASLLRTVHRLVREVRSPRTTFTELRRMRTAGFLTWPAA
ncbi:hypothetical protein OG874_32645 [Nocardia sp. NBC_00565]|uniref:hypothetical protein n=1 Tax=Nocardia sp. NBC_00565 TaxID=2975993 RepID=UPI002E80FF5E|nr:hypothetical protein [Nocardia sp. NBC_00565]WUC01514.1 hypothetical protein OG874_32645 [Nocardia sp. NBC_00565]